MKYEIYPEGVYEHGDRRPLSGWRWRQLGRNGEIVSTGESYTRKADARRAVVRARGRNLQWEIGAVDFDREIRAVAKRRR